jgi:putative tryptophan/tyrosine transport system substrate-binding protein
VIPDLGTEPMRRRDFIAVVGGSVAGWPLVARAQRLEQVRKIGMLVNYSSEDPEGQARVKAFA